MKPKLSNISRKASELTPLLSVPNRTWFLVALFSLLATSILAGTKVSRLLHTASAPLINGTTYWNPSRLFLSTPTSHTVGEGGSFQVRLDSGNLASLSKITIRFEYDPRFLKIESVQTAGASCADIINQESSVADGVLAFSCTNPAVVAGENLYSLATVKYVPLSTGTTVIRINQNQSRLEDSGKVNANLLRFTENTVVTFHAPGITVETEEEEQ